LPVRARRRPRQAGAVTVFTTMKELDRVIAGAASAR
jgi:hypothetical protein